MPQNQNAQLYGTLSASSVSGTLQGNENLSAGLTLPHVVLETDYNRLQNKPQINGVELVGNKTSQDLYLVSENTTAGWNENPLYLPKRGEICVYTDHTMITDDLGNTFAYPGIKIGDGNAYLIDLPFIGDDIRYEILQQLRAHTSNTVIHITQEEREFWNRKLNYEYDDAEETLILNRN